MAVAEDLLGAHRSGLQAERCEPECLRPLRAQRRREPPRAVLEAGAAPHRQPAAPEAPPGDEPRPAQPEELRRPPDPTQQMKHERRLLHIPYELWCDMCVGARSIDDPYWPPYLSGEL